MNEWQPVVAYRPGIKRVLTVPNWLGGRYTASWLIRHPRMLRTLLWSLNRLTTF